MNLVTGDLVTVPGKMNGLWGALGVIVGAVPSNNDDRMTNVFPLVYYVFFAESGVVGPLFGSELRLC